MIRLNLFELILNTPKYLISYTHGRIVPFIVVCTVAIKTTPNTYATQWRILEGAAVSKQGGGSHKHGLWPPPFNQLSPFKNPGFATDATWFFTFIHISSEDNSSSHRFNKLGSLNDLAIAAGCHQHTRLLRINVDPHFNERVTISIRYIVKRCGNNTDTCMPHSMHTHS